MARFCLDNLETHLITLVCNAAVLNITTSAIFSMFTSSAGDSRFKTKAEVRAAIKRDRRYTPIIIQMIAITLPKIVDGTLSPYPTVSAVTIENLSEETSRCFWQD